MNTSKLIRDLEKILQRINSGEKEFAQLIQSAHPKHRLNAKNLVHYLALRSMDLRKLQKNLAQQGLSSLGSSEGYVLNNLSNILNLLYLMEASPTRLPEMEPSYRTSRRLIRKHTKALFGTHPQKLPAHIMVTLPSAAGEDYQLVKSMMSEGMDIARINLSHDSPETWQKMIDNICRAEQELKLPCKIYADLAGPKIRTSTVAITRGKKKAIDYLTLHRGDQLWLYPRAREGQNAVVKDTGEIVTPARISLSLPRIFNDLEVGHRIFFDDGKIGGLIKGLDQEKAVIEITQASLKGAKLRAEKGINLPDTQLDLPAMTDEDILNLDFVARHADIVGYSFVRRASDVAFLQEQLAKRTKKSLGIVLKIETSDAFNNLPNILLRAMQSEKIGVMIARGDLAVELGFERISEVQEQILWICEAAHVPVIWATQVLENLAKKGIASRAEITDAAMSVRAECVMLNKGPYILETIRTLGNILKRMEAHQIKKKGTLRPLHLSRNFLKSKPKKIIRQSPPP